MMLSIVGCHFRPPAKDLLQVMATGTPLMLVREPENPYDPNAIKVMVATTDIDEAWADDLRPMLASRGLDWSDLQAEPEWHLGYIPRTEAEVLAVSFDAHGEPVHATLAFDMTGKPAVVFEAP